ncbi:MAG: ribonucleoside-diphosphate reductase subunit alpha [Candidatus Babeliales bacterium]
MALENQKNQNSVSSMPPVQSKMPLMQVVKRNGNAVEFDEKKIRAMLKRSTHGIADEVSIDQVVQEFIRNIFDGVSTQTISDALILAAAAFIEQEGAYDTLAVRLYLQKIYKEVIGVSITDETIDVQYREAFVENIKRAVDYNILDPRMLTYDLDLMARGMQRVRDEEFAYLGIHTVYGRYFIRHNGNRLETPQAFWMRVAMGLALKEVDKHEKALEFYEVLSTRRYIASTPTLFHAGLQLTQLSSCYLTTIDDSLEHIFKCMGDNAQLSKYAGGIGNDWTNVRGIGSVIRSIHATSQGIVPFMKIANDVVAGITKSGIRRGGTCAYLECWHLDYEDFIDLRRNVGDERRRTHDMNTASWIPDLFMKRMLADQDWTFFSPDDVTDLHDLYGDAFERRYIEYERKIETGDIKRYGKTSARKLWRKMLSRLFETGHPWVTFKDPCNIRSPQDHAGVVHSSNLCTEITLNTSFDETAVCNLGSINLERHIDNGMIDEPLMARTIRIAIRMLDNVIDLNFYPTIEAKNSNMRHRPIGLGVMGFQDALYKLDVTFDSQKAIEVADHIGEMYSYYAILASSELAKERGTYKSYRGSKWFHGNFPVDTIDLLEKERGMKIEIDRTCRMNWKPVREHVARYGIRNSNVMAVAPTATISNIAGCFPTIEPIYKNIYVKSNISGEFTIINKYLVADLKKRGLWNNEIIEKLKYYDGSVALIEELPQDLKIKYKTAFELDPEHLIRITAARGKWIDQSQSHNIFMAGVSGKKLSEIYITAWKMGLKTTYYLRTLGASQIEKSTLDSKKYGFTQKREYTTLEDEGQQQIDSEGFELEKRACSLNPEDCESCQ